MFLDDAWAREPQYHMSSWSTLGAEAIRAHFADAIAAGEHYDHLRIDKHTLAPRYLDGKSSSTQRLQHLPPPRRLRLDVPLLSKDLRTRAAEMYLSLPIFTKVTELSFTDEVGHHLWVVLMEYKGVRSIRLGRGSFKTFLVSSMMLSEPGNILFPALKEIHVGEQDFTDMPLAAQNISTMVLQAAFKMYIGRGKKAVAVFHDSSCKEALPVVEWLQKKFGADNCLLV